MSAPSRLHSCARSIVKSGSRSSRFEFGEGVDDLIAGADRDDHDGNIDVATEEAGTLPLSRVGAVDAEKH